MAKSATLLISRLGTALLTVQLVLSFQSDAVSQTRPARGAPRTGVNKQQPHRQPSKEAAGSREDRPRLVEVGAHITRSTAGGKEDTFILRLTRSQFVRVVVGQKDVDVSVTLLAPTGARLAHVNSAYGVQGPDTLIWVSSYSGDYSIKVTCDDKARAGGEYDISIAELRSARPDDQKRIVAQRLYDEADQLVKRGTGAAKLLAIKKYEQALTIRRQAGDQTEEAATLNAIGDIAGGLGRTKEALDRFNQALALARKLGDRAAEGLSLNNLASAYYSTGEVDKSREHFTEALAIAEALGNREWQSSTLNNIGALFDGISERQKALEYYDRALSISRALGDADGEANTLNNIGLVNRHIGKMQVALDHYNKALEMCRERKNLAGQALSLNNIGAAYFQMGDAQKAIESLNQALTIYRDSGDRSGEADVAINLSGVYLDLKENRKAIDLLQRALAILRETGDRSGESSALNNLAAAYHHEGQNPEALAKYTQSLRLKRATKDREGEANTLGNLGSLYLDMGERKKALEYLNQSLPIRREIDDKRGLGSNLHNIGSVYEEMGDRRKALSYYEEAIPLRRETQDRRGIAVTLGSAAGVLADFGETQKALEYYDEALRIRRDVKDVRGVANTLNNTGTLYASIDDNRRALDCYNEALPLWRAISDHRGEASTLTNIGAVFKGQSEMKRALEYFNQALAVSRAGKDRKGEAKALGNIGAVYVSERDYDRAIEFLNQTLSAGREIGDRQTEATTLAYLGDIYLARGDTSRALDHYNHALAISREVETLSQTASILKSLSRIERGRNNPAGSMALLQEAIAIVELMRAKPGGESLRTAYFSTARGFYAEYIELLFEMHRREPASGYDAAALTVSEKARARSLLDLLTEAQARIRTGADPALLEKEKSLREELGGKRLRQMQLRSITPSSRQAANLARELAELKRDIDSRDIEYRNVEAKLKSSSPHYAALSQPVPLNATEIQQRVVDGDTLLLEYSLGDKHSFLWAVTPATLESFELPPRGEIEKAASQLYELLTSRGTNRAAETQTIGRPAGPEKQLTDAIAQLSDIVLGPVRKLLGGKRLLVVADGALQYIPFGVLSARPVQDQGTKIFEPLIVTNEVVNATSASALELIRRQVKGRASAPKQIVVFADPVFELDDPRVTPRAADQAQKPTPPARNTVSQRAQNSGREPSIAEFQRLPFSRDEAEDILSLLPKADAMKVLDFAASRETVTRSALDQYRVVHFATHAVMNASRPELSGIVLSLVDERGGLQDGFLRLDDIYNLRLNADLVVLSACRTALGREMRGEGMVGLTRGFFYSGASRVIASLWNVSDRATAELMKRLYQKMLSGKMRPSVALREAQLEMYKQERWQAPFYWAGFVLQGEWK